VLKKPVEKGQYDEIRRLIKDWEGGRKEALATVKKGQQATKLIDLMVLIGYIDDIKQAVS
jgi:hypothetical protein